MEYLKETHTLQTRVKSRAKKPAAA
jgi:hypothetical protein